MVTQIREPAPGAGWFSLPTRLPSRITWGRGRILLKILTARAFPRFVRTPGGLPRCSRCVAQAKTQCPQMSAQSRPGTPSVLHLPPQESVRALLFVRGAGES